MQPLNLLSSFTISAFAFYTPGFNDQPVTSQIAMPAITDEDTIRKHVGKFFEALSAEKFKVAREYTYSHEDCEKVFGMLENLMKDPEVKRNPAPTIKDIKIEKDRATVIFVETGQPMQLEKFEGHWKIHMCGKK